jgi:hypothetical protein
VDDVWQGFCRTAGHCWRHRTELNQQQPDVSDV